ncbi:MULTISPECIES: helix-turn-helix domain-containing protein [unclassified Bacillus cereus group]|uniref:helix-turn-helix domain-containing protein n=1 Tax=Bacillus cereus group TaxID=86661 RepID=UPI0033946A92
MGKRKNAQFRRDTWIKLLVLERSEDEFESEYARVIGTLVRYRIEKELTQSELAERSGLSVTTISNIESLHSVPSLKNYLKYVRGLDVEFGFRKRG